MYCVNAVKEIQKIALKNENKIFFFCYSTHQHLIICFFFGILMRNMRKTQRC